MAPRFPHASGAAALHGTASMTAMLSLLTSARPDEVVVDPFAHLVRTGALAAEEYEALAERFPSLELIGGAASSHPSNVAVRMGAGDAIACSEISAVWRRFLEVHTSREYWRDVVRVFGEALRAAFPTLEARIGRRFEDWRVARRGSDEAADVRLDCQFVMNTPVTEPSSVKTPHVDRHDKIFSALLYMRAERDRTTGGDLDLYRWRRTPRFVKHRALPADIERVNTIRYAANTYVGFVNSPRSVHGVSPRDVTANTRRYINFIAEIPGPAFEPVQAGPWLRWRHRRGDDA
jgi:hypothetical protein